MGWLTSLLGLGSRALDRILPDRARLQEKNLRSEEHTSELQSPY